jgi:hypothetical protein
MILVSTDGKETRFISLFFGKRSSGAYQGLLVQSTPFAVKSLSLLPWSASVVVLAAFVSQILLGLHYLEVRIWTVTFPFESVAAAMVVMLTAFAVVGAIVFTCQVPRAFQRDYSGAPDGSYLRIDLLSSTSIYVALSIGAMNLCLFALETAFLEDGSNASILPMTAFVLAASALSGIMRLVWIARRHTNPFIQWKNSRTTGKRALPA